MPSLEDALSESEGFSGCGSRILHARSSRSGNGRNIVGDGGGVGHRNVTGLVDVITTTFCRGG